ncbi:alanine-zipper protein [Gordonia crocea]|uniref:alanine-zipper protein n=1 Tax=Gordonia crocea TaxID=589162 RepID=UPI001379AA21
MADHELVQIHVHLDAPDSATVPPPGSRAQSARSRAQSARSRAQSARSRAQSARSRAQSARNRAQSAVICRRSPRASASR